MKRARTDAELSIQASEFVWNGEGLSEAHAYILPPVLEWLLQAGAKRVLDLGCGNGAVTCELAKNGLKTVGLDTSATGIEIASRSYPEVEFVEADLNAPLPLDLHDAFDAVIALEVLEHLLLPRSLFHRAKEALGERGLFIASTPFHGYWKNLALALANKFDDHWHPLRDYGHVKFFSRETLCRLFCEQSFEVVRAKRAGRVPVLAKSIIVEGRLR